jgi:hypothetical protein
MKIKVGLNVNASMVAAMDDVSQMIRHPRRRRSLTSRASPTGTLM